MITNFSSFSQIIDGRISFKFDYGSGPGHVRINDIQVNDGEWHHVEVTRVGNFATVRLDNGKFQKSGQSPGKSAKINLNGNIIYFGAGVVSAGKFFFRTISDILKTCQL